MGGRVVTLVGEGFIHISLSPKVCTDTIFDGLDPRELTLVNVLENVNAKI